MFPLFLHGTNWFILVGSGLGYLAMRLSGVEVVSEALRAWWLHLLISLQKSMLMLAEMHLTKSCSDVSLGILFAVYWIQSTPRALEH